MSTRLAGIVVVVVAASVVALAASAFLIPIPSRVGSLDIALWVLAAVVTSAAPIRLPRGTHASVSAAPVLAAAFVGGPTAAAVVALLGTIEKRELLGEVPWYGTLYNHASFVLPAVAAGAFYVTWTGGALFDPSFANLTGALLAGWLFVIGNTSLTALVLGAREGSVRRVVAGDISIIAVSMAGTAPVAWLIAQTYVSVGPWAAALFVVPLYSTRAAYRGFVDVRRAFTQTISSLASAIDARDPYTKSHSENVKDIAVAIGREMRGRSRCSERELQVLELGGLLHDIGKIGVPDAILRKPDRLTAEERKEMNQHPEKGAAILKEVEKLRDERLIIRHHHEWYNGSGYPDHLIGEQIPKLARILHVADAFEAMTSARPYRMIPLTNEQAMTELRKYTGIQFDPEVVEAFSRTSYARGSRPLAPEPPTVPMLQHVAAARAQAQRTH